MEGIFNILLGLTTAFCLYAIIGNTAKIIESEDRQERNSLTGWLYMFIIIGGFTLFLLTCH